MYYLQSRYYDANVGRFVNVDEAAMNSDVCILWSWKGAKVHFIALWGYRLITIKK